MVDRLMFLLIFLSALIFTIFSYQDGDWINFWCYFLSFVISGVGIRNILGVNSVWFLLLLIAGVNGFLVDSYIWAAVCFVFAGHEWYKIINKGKEETVQ